MKRSLTLSLIALSTVLFFSSCRKHALAGSGSTGSETRSLDNFSTIQADGSTDIEIHPSNTNKVVVSGYENLIPYYETEVRGNTLHLDFKEGYWNIRNNNIKVTVYTTDASAVRLNGSGKVMMHAGLSTNTMDVDISGSGDVYIDDNNFSRFDCRVNGSGSIDARNANCDEVYADISGSGDIDVTVNDVLDAKISGSGSVDYWGSPEVVNTDISGSGEVTKKN
jgi:hypothetical protein